MKRLLVLLATSLALGAVPSNSGARTDNPEFVLGKWDLVPHVIVCPDSPASLEEVERAVAWWSKRGHWLNVIDLEQSRRAKKVCENVWDSWPSGYIVISELTDTMEREKDDIALTYVAKLPLKHEMIWAKVFIVRNKIAKHPRIVEHELGHALGYRHLPTEGHMMHPIISDDGWGDALLQR